MRVLVTGGAGFIGANTVDRLLNDGHEVAVIDDLSRRGSERNLDWLRQRHGPIPFYRLDVRDYGRVLDTMGEYREVDLILHFAAQVAVTTSVDEPRRDFEINALGAFNVLEAVRELGLDPVLMYSSTNKVYGALSHMRIIEEETRYRIAESDAGVSEQTPMDFYSPYGCSKGTADQYFRDYHRIYGLRTIVFRNSCIYGPRQFGVEDQGWVAWFVIAAVQGRPITIYGDGKQVRDLLYVEDLIDAMMLAVEHVGTTGGEIYNIGGGPENSISIWKEFGPMLSELLGAEIPVGRGEWRPGDQPLYVSDISKARQDFGWAPKVGVREGVGRLVEWVRANPELFA
jgi:CDP-paratose 2-epimerase